MAPVRTLDSRAVVAQPHLAINDVVAAIAIEVGDARTVAARATVRDVVPLERELAIAPVPSGDRDAAGMAVLAGSIAAAHDDAWALAVKVSDAGRIKASLAITGGVAPDTLQLS